VTFRVSVEEDPAPADKQVVVDGLLAFNVGYIGDPGVTPMAVFLRGADGEVLGGLLGRVKWRWLYIEKFWLPDSLRGQGHGSRLLAAAEDFAAARGCLGVHLDTFEYQALPFYRRHGYEVFGVHEGFPPGYRQYHLKKDLR
jgi:GNAT superfamily N-acetyltransferase